MHPTKFQINWVAMDILHDVFAQYNDFIDKTNTANIESGISFHCLTMGGLLAWFIEFTMSCITKAPELFSQSLPQWFWL